MGSFRFEIAQWQSLQKMQSTPRRKTRAKKGRYGCLFYAANNTRLRTEEPRRTCVSRSVGSTFYGNCSCFRDQSAPPFVTGRADRKPQVRQCLGFSTADFLSSLPYESAEQKPKHFQTSDFPSAVVTRPSRSISRATSTFFRSLSLSPSLSLSLRPKGQRSTMGQNIFGSERRGERGFL